MARLRDHIVICNWSERTADLVRSLHSDMFISHANQQDWHPVVVVAENVERFPDEDAFRGTMLLPGSPLNARILERANIRDAYAVVVMADPAAPDADDRSILIAINASSLLQESRTASGFRPVEPTRVIVEIVNPERAQLMRSQKLSLVDEIVCQTDLNIRVVAQSNISQGLSLVLRDLLEFSEDTDEIYLIKVPADWDGLQIARAGFFPLVRWIAARSRQDSAPAGGPATLLVGFARGDGGQREMIVNPKKLEYENKGGLAAGDALILVARDREAALRVLTFREDGADGEIRGMSASA